MVAYLPAMAPLGEQHQAFDAMSRFCGLASNTARSLSAIPGPTIQSLATECGQNVFVPDRMDKLAVEAVENQWIIFSAFSSPPLIQHSM